MNKWAVLGIVVLSAFLGWRAGLVSGEAERRAIIDDLPEARVYFRELLADLDEPAGRDLVCEQIFNSVRKELSEEYRLDAADMNELYDQMDRQRD